MAAAKEARPAYVGAIVEDSDSGTILFEDNPDGVSPPASMTKLMTFAVVHDKLADGSLKLDTPVTVTAADSKIGGTQVWLKEGEVFSVEELLYARADVVEESGDAELAELNLVAPPLGWRLLDDDARDDAQRQFALCVESALDRLGLGPLSHRGP